MLLEAKTDRSRRNLVLPEVVVTSLLDHLLGHSSIVLTSNTYGHVLERRQRLVARGMDAVLGG
jgi:hypothetical protein